MAHYLDPKNDVTFKLVFGEHEGLCMSLLNSMLPLDVPIVSIKYQTGELLPSLPSLRNSIVDVYCKDANGRRFIVEMQMYWSESFKSRVLFNASKVYVKQLNQGDEIKLLHPVYSLNFVNDTFEKSPEKAHEYYHHYKIVNIKDTEKQIKGLEFVFIELVKFKPQNRAEKKLHELWLRFLTEINERTEDAPAELLENAETREAMGYMQVAAYTKEQLEAYEKWKLDILTERSALEDSKAEGEAIGLKKGLAEGETIGLEKGLAEGKGIGERKKAAAVALKALEMGMSIEVASQLSSLSKEEIEKLTF